MKTRRLMIWWGILEILKCSRNAFYILIAPAKIKPFSSVAMI
ncbi:hypothetical protein ACTIGL_16505 [Bacillus shihchuchen]